MRALIPNTPFIDPKTKDMHPAWRQLLMVLADRLHYGEGSPEGQESAPVGHYYFDMAGGAGTVFYVKETSPTLTTGWVAK